MTEGSGKKPVISARDGWQGKATATSKKQVKAMNNSADQESGGLLKKPWFLAHFIELDFRRGRRLGKNDRR